MKKLTLALFIFLMSLLIIAPKLWAQALICEEVNGILWCYNDQACGQACNDVCGTIDSQPIADNTIWFEAQDTTAECQAISQAFGLGSTVNSSNHSFACLEDSGGTHTVGGGLLAPLFCSTVAGCPADHRTKMDQLGVPCGTGSRRSICPCVAVAPPSAPPSGPIAIIPTMGQWGMIIASVILGFFAIIRLRRIKDSELE